MGLNPFAAMNEFDFRGIRKMPRKKRSYDDGDYDEGGDAGACVDTRCAEDICMDVAGFSPEVKRKAIWLRNNMTSIEKSVWAKLGKDSNPWGFLRQYPVKNFYADFFSENFLTILEIDGPDHVFRKTEDLRRDQILASHGIATLRLNILDLKLMRGTEFFDAITNFLENSDSPEEA